MAKFTFASRLNRRKRKSVRSMVLSFSVARKMETIAMHGHSILRPRAFRHSTAGTSQVPQGLAKLLLFGFLGGFILNLMPCVLPVISLKIFGFVQHAGDSRARILRSGLAFVAGIFVWFIGLALVLDRAEDGRARDDLGGSIHQSLLCSRDERGRAGVRAQSLWCFRNFAAAKRHFIVDGCDRARRRCRLVFPGHLRHDSRDTVHRAISRNGARLRLHAIVRDDSAHVPRDRGGNERALSSSFRATGMATFSAEARPMDGAREAVDGISPARDAAFSALGPWRASAASSAVIWTSAFLLVLSLACWMKGAFLLPTTARATRAVVLRAHARARTRQRLLFCREKISRRAAFAC